MVQHGKCLWSEDDATTFHRDYETLDKAWLRLFGTPFRICDAVETSGDEEATWCRMPNGAVVCSTYPGDNAIYEGAA